MLHDEIVSGFYAKLKNINIPVFKYYSNKAGERIVLQLKANVKSEVFQNAQVWVIVYAKTLNNLPDVSRLNQIVDSIKTNLDGVINMPSGEVILANLISTDGVFIDEKNPNECFMILRYSVKAR